MIFKLFDAYWQVLGLAAALSAHLLVNHRFGRCLLFIHISFLILSACLVVVLYRMIPMKGFMYGVGAIGLGVGGISLSAGFFAFLRGQMVQLITAHPLALAVYIIFASLVFLFFEERFTVPTKKQRLAINVLRLLGFLHFLYVIQGSYGTEVALRMIFSSAVFAFAFYSNSRLNARTAKTPTELEDSPLADWTVEDMKVWAQSSQVEPLQSQARSPGGDISERLGQIIAEHEIDGETLVEDPDRVYKAIEKEEGRAGACSKMIRRIKSLRKKHCGQASEFGDSLTMNDSFASTE